MYDSIENSNSQKIANEIVAFTTLFVLFICIITNLICICNLLRNKKFRTNAKCELLLQLFLFKLFGLIRPSILIDIFKLDSKNSLICRLEYFIWDFSDSSADFLLFILWIILMSERNMIGFKFLYSNERTNESIFRLTKRTILVTSFYVATLIYSLLYAAKYDFLFVYLCGNLKFLTVFKFSFHLLPFSIWLLIFSTFLWNYFGGKRDPVLGELNSCDHRLIKYIKIISILKCLDIFLTYIIISNDFYSFYHISILLSLTISLISFVTFLTFENDFSVYFREHVFTSLLRTGLYRNNIIINGINV